MNRESVAAVINACDAGREGELIFRNLYQLTNCTKPVQRLWISSMEESAIWDGLQNLRDGSEYDSLYASALCRAKADWLVGINATRFFSLCYDRTLSVGRVMSPTLALIVKREEEINDFVPEHFYTVALDFWYGPERCPQIDAYSLLCRYFKRSVLPAEPELEAELLRTKPKKRCAVCGKPFFTRFNAAKYCKDCAKEQHRKREQERQRKRYESLRK